MGGVSPAAGAALEWIPTICCSLFVALRLFTRIKLHLMGIEDYLTIVSMVFLIVAVALVPIRLLGDPDYLTSINEASTERASSAVCSLLCLLFGKLSVATLLLKIIGPASPWKRVFVFATSSCLILVTILAVIMTIWQPCGLGVSPIHSGACSPSELLYNVVELVMIFYGVFFDLAYNTLPILIARKLQMPNSKKLLLCILLGLGWTASVFSVLRCVRVFVSGDDNPALILDLLSWRMECALVIICGSLSTLVPLFESLWHGKSLASRISPEYEGTAVVAQGLDRQNDGTDSRTALTSKRAVGGSDEGLTTIATTLDGGRRDVPERLEKLLPTGSFQERTQDRVVGDTDPA